MEDQSNERCGRDVTEKAFGLRKVVLGSSLEAARQGRVKLGICDRASRAFQRLSSFLLKSGGDSKSPF